VVDSGEGSTNAVPVYEGFVINKAIRRNFIAGKAITEYFSTLMSQEDGGGESSGGGTSWNTYC
jgi:actin-related protein